MAKKTVKEVVTKWGFQVDKKPLMELKTAVAGVKANMFALGASAVGSAVAIFGLAEHTADAANEMRFASLRAGMSTKSFQEMAFAAKMSGVSTESFGHAMQFLNRNMFAARMGSKEAGSAFYELGGGVAASVRAGASNVQIMKMVADRMAGIKDPARVGAIAMKIFGRGGAELLPLLKQGSKGIDEFSKKAEEMGIVLSDDTIKDAEEFHETMEEVKGNILGFKNTIGAALIGPVNDIMKVMTRWMTANRAFINSQVKDFVKGLQENLKITATIFGKVLQVVTALVRPFWGLGSAIKYVLLGFTAIKALNMLSALGQMAQAVVSLGVAWKGLAASEILADAAAAAIPIAIGAAIILIGLAIEDLWGFFNGKNSVFGKIIEMFKEHFPNATKFISGAISTVTGAFHSLTSVISETWKYVNKIFDAFETRFPKIAALVKLGLAGISAVSGFGSPGSVLSAGQGAAEAFFGSKATPAPMGPSAATLSSIQGEQSQSSTVIQAPVTINVPPGTHPEAVGAHVQKGVKDAFDNMLRSALLR